MFWFVYWGPKWLELSGVVEPKFSLPLTVNKNERPLAIFRFTGLRKMSHLCVESVTRRCVNSGVKFLVGSPKSHFISVFPTWDAALKLVDSLWLTVIGDWSLNKKNTRYSTARVFLCTGRYVAPNFKSVYILNVFNFRKDPIGKLRIKMAWPYCLSLLYSFRLDFELPKSFILIQYFLICLIMCIKRGKWWFALRQRSLPST